MASSQRSEDVYGEKIDRCLYNSLIKFVGGVGVGIVFSAFLFKRKPWPVLLGGGIGAGMGISDCNYEFRDDSLLSGKSRLLQMRLLGSGATGLDGVKDGTAMGGIPGDDTLGDSEKGGPHAELLKSSKSCLCKLKSKPEKPETPRKFPRCRKDRGQEPCDGGQSSSAE